MTVRSYSVAPKNDQFLLQCQVQNFALKTRGICRVFNIFVRNWKIRKLMKPFIKKSKSSEISKKPYNF
jgi:hypothetical protein